MGNSICDHDWRLFPYCWQRQPDTWTRKSPAISINQYKESCILCSKQPFTGHFNTYVRISEQGHHVNSGTLPENGDDEAYVTASSVRTPSGQENAWHVWDGELSDSDDDINRHYARGLLVGDYTLRPGESVVIVINVFEQDGDDYGPGLKAAVEIAQKVGAAVAGAPGGDEVLAKLFGINLSSLVDVTASFWKNTDDYIGSFTIIASNKAGQLETRIYPTGRARWVSNSPGPLRLDGDGAEYYPSVYVNGLAQITGHH